MTCFPLLVVGLIPARAGNTESLIEVTEDSGAHPRSRGEHKYQVPDSHPEPGSSPLARGTRKRNATQSFLSGLIPARAGNTSGSLWDRVTTEAHPRSRGEHVPPDAQA